jgi:c-di-GMP-binding flagellar brake protein YcgR
MAKIIKTANDIDPTDKIELTVDSPDGKSVTTGQSMVLDVTDEGIIISIPTANKVTMPLPKGTPVEASIWKNYAEHRFRTRVLDRRILKIPQLVLERTFTNSLKPFLNTKNTKRSTS